MYAWAVRWMIRRSVRRLNDGDIGPLLSSYAPDATLVFPGNSSWGGEYRGRDAIEGFLRRFVAAGLQLEPKEILVAGAPWNTTVCMHFTDRARAPDGAVVYENRGVIYAKVRWGRITFQEDFEDTHKVEILDAYLASHAETTA